MNPTSGTDRATALLPRIKARLRTLVRDLDITVTTNAEDAARAAAGAVDDRADALYVAGDDGTLNAALRGLHPRFVQFFCGMQPLARDESLPGLISRKT